MALAAASPAIRSVAGSQFNERPFSKAMLAGCAIETERWAASIGATVGLREKQLSMKFVT